MAAASGLQNGSPAEVESGLDYSQWSNSDLVKRISVLEAQLRAQCSQYSNPTRSSPLPVPTTKKPRKVAKLFDPSKYSTRHIALKFAYLGRRYNGFEHHANNKTPRPTVEEELWKALRKTKLIFPDFKEGQSEDEVCWDACEYSKCGRTDRGVSAFGQVIGLRVRSSRPKEMTVKNGVQVNGMALDRNMDVGDNDSISDDTTPPADNLTPAWESARDELPYIQLLNRVLPPDIRILAWCPNPPVNFSARFNCKERRYRYFFTNPAYMPDPRTSNTAVGDAWLDIRAMQEAAKKLEGLHDFRNFCKVDPSKQITNFERRIFHASINRVNSDSQPCSFLKEAPFVLTEPLQMYYFEVHGSAFLWHQVRHMIAILFLVGQGYETPSVVDELLDVNGYPAKPVYDMADEIPLVLWDCIFPEPSEVDANERGNSKAGEHEDALEWIYVGDGVSGTPGTKRSVTEAMQDRKYGRLGIMEDLWALWQRRKMDEVLAGSLMDVVARQGTPAANGDVAEKLRLADTTARVFDGSETPRNVGDYVPIMHRQRMEKPEVLNARYAVRKGLNGS